VNDQKPLDSQTPERISPLRVAIKALALFALLNLLWALLNPLPALAKLSIYNWLVPGRERLPFGENPDQAYNLSLYSLEAMFASHAVSRPPRVDEYRVFLIGDSSTWGYLLEPEDTLAGLLNAMELAAPDGRPVRFYNLGHPTISLTKDLMLLDYAMQYEPDLIIWLATLEAMPVNKQLASPIVQNNAARVRDLIVRFDLSLDLADPNLVDPSFWERTLAGQRRAVADVVRLNLYGPMWAATGIDQFYPETYTPRQEDFEEDDSFYDLEEPLAPGDLALDVLDAGIQAAGDVPVLIVNEPIFVSMGENSDIRYNFFYPRWAYDGYRAIMDEQARLVGWRYLDLWNVVDSAEFTNSAIHLTPEGSAQLAARLRAALAELLEEAPEPVSLVEESP
jgi:hypothetical protein